MKTFGWRGVGLFDQRDLKYSYQTKVAIGDFTSVDEPMVKDLIIGPITDQSTLGSCGTFASTGNMVATGEENTGQPKNLSQLWLYYRYRELYSHVEYDDGVFLRDLIKVLADDGVCLEEDWPYELKNWDKKPPIETYNKAKENRITSYHALYTIDEMIQCIASGYSFFGGIYCYESIDSLYTEKTGLIEIPKTNEKLVGGHAILFSKYDKHKQMFGGPNSWGTEWGDNGKFTISFEYLANRRLSDDFWTIRR